MEVVKICRARGGEKGEKRKESSNPKTKRRGKGEKRKEKRVRILKRIKFLEHRGTHARVGEYLVGMGMPSASFAVDFSSLYFLFSC